MAIFKFANCNKLPEVIPLLGLIEIPEWLIRSDERHCNKWIPDDPSLFRPGFMLPRLVWKWWFIVDLQYPLKMVIFHSYVNLPEGNVQPHSPMTFWCHCQKLDRTPNSWDCHQSMLIEIYISMMLEFLLLDGSHFFYMTIPPKNQVSLTASQWMNISGCEDTFFHRP